MIGVTGQFAAVDDLLTGQDLLHQHLALPYPLLAQLLGVNRTTISRAIQQTRPLLDQHGLATARPPATRLHTLAGISAYAASHGIMPSRNPKQRVNHLRALGTTERYLHTLTDADETALDAPAKIRNRAISG